jgi:hypothetical protein
MIRGNEIGEMERRSRDLTRSKRRVIWGSKTSGRLESN